MILGNISQKIEACQPPGRRLRGVTDSWPRARGPIRRSNGKSEARTISAGWRSMASAETQDWVAALSKRGLFTTWVPERASATPPKRLCSAKWRQAGDSDRLRNRADVQL